MSRIPLVLRELHRAENSMAGALLAIADRHRVEAEVFHVARDLARWSRIHVRDISETGRAHGVDLDPNPPTRTPAEVRRLARRAAVVLRRRPEPGLLLLMDLRRLHRKAAGVSMDWELLGQVAQGMRKQDLLDLSKRCHPQTLRQLRWTDAQLKTVSPQILSG